MNRSDFFPRKKIILHKNNSFQLYFSIIIWENGFRSFHIEYLAYITVGGHGGLGVRSVDGERRLERQRYAMT